MFGVRNSATKVITVPGSSVTRNTSASALSCRSGGSPDDGVM